MLKLALYGKVNKKVEEILTQYFNKANIKMEIYKTSNSLKFMTDYLNDGEIRILIGCMDESIIYMIKTNIYEMGNNLVVGHMSFPPRENELYNSLIRNYELSNISVHGRYTVKGIEDRNEILHEDIEYIKGEGKKSIFYLKDGFSISSDEELSKVERELGKEYFIKSSPKVIVNGLNIYKLYNSEGYLSKIEFISGAMIPVSRIYAKRFLDSYLLLTHESATLRMYDT